MPRFRRLAVLLLPLALGLGAVALPGRAQQASSSRFAFADTTLLRDTLGLDFSQLFHTADSLKVLPDSLRAWMIRYTMSIPRLLAVADSMRYPVDSVGPVLERERFNPLAARPGGAPLTEFRYTSSYNIGQTNTAWNNGADYTLSRGPLYLRNNTTISLDRYKTAGRLSLRQTRSAATEAGWRFGEGLSLGGRARLDRFFSSGSLTRSEGETKNEFQVSLRSQQSPNESLTGELNMFSGLLDLDNSSQVKRGINGDVNGRLRYDGGWLTHDVSGQFTGNLARARSKTRVESENTRDLSSYLRGTLGVAQNRRLGLVVNYQVRQSSVESPTATNEISRIITSNNSVDGTLQGNVDNNRYLSLTGRLGTTQQSNGTRDDGGAELSGRWLLVGWALEGRVRENRATANYPLRDELFGYDERSVTRSTELVATRSIGARMNARLAGNISLDRLRYRATADSATLPVDRDNYRQSVRAEGSYSPSVRMNSTVALEVGLTSQVNIPGRATSSNTDLRSYRAEWRWTYRLLQGLTVNQTNSVTAEYRLFPFGPDRNDLSLDYNSLTNLAATLTPRLNINVSHNLREQPRGSYVELEPGREYLLPSDEGRNYTLQSTVTYTPVPQISLTLSPDYQKTSRVGNQNGVEVPQRSSKSLNFSGGASLNLKLGRRGLLTGGIQRRFQSSRAITYQAGEAQVSPSSQQDFWTGALQLSWNL